MKEIRVNADIHFLTQGTNFNIRGMSFLQEKSQAFDAAIKELLGV